jgi:TetR/AcrR family transcriptional regulator, fatty acid metabolism regulator protein
MRTREGNKEKDIIDAAVVVFGRHGYAKAKIHHIADGAGVATGTVYLYFRNKEKLLLRILEQVWEELCGMVVAIHGRTDLDPAEKMHGVIDAVFGHFASNPLLARVFINEQQQLIHSHRNAPFMRWYEKTLDESEAIIDEGQAKGCFNREISKRFFRQFFFGGIRHIILQWATDPKSISLDDLKKDIKTAMLSGIAIPGRK